MASHTIAETSASFAELAAQNRAFARRYPGPTPDRQPVHTVYGGGHLFKADTAPKLGVLAKRSLAEHAPNAFTFARAIGLPGHEHLPATVNETKSTLSALRENAATVKLAHPHAWFAHTVYERVLAGVTRLRRGS